MFDVAAVVEKKRLKLSLSVVRIIVQISFIYMICRCDGKHLVFLSDY